MDNKGASLMSFVEGDNTMNVYVVYNLLLVLVVLNLLGLVPGVLTPGTSMPRLAFFRLMIFIAGSLVQIVLDLLGYLVIFVPGGAPIVLLPLLYVIEIVSYFIRPLALVIRICVNMFCGHMLLVLGGLIGKVMVIFLVLLLEFGVAVVQGYVYSMILLL